MIIKSLEYIDRKLNSFLTGLNWVKNENKLTPRYYSEEIGKLNQRIELLENGIDQILKNSLPNPIGHFDSLMLIMEKKLSVGRFGDGEFRLMYEPRYSLEFQKNDLSLIKRLKEIIFDENVEKFNYLNGITWGYGGSWYFRKAMIYAFNDFKNTKLKYLDAKITWRVEQVENIKIWQKIFYNRDVVFVVGKGGMFNYQPELFDNIMSYQIVYAPPVDAWTYYNEILNFCSSLSNHKLILCSLGPTATVLSYDLAKMGFQAIDIGALPHQYAKYKNRSIDEQDENVFIRKAVFPPVYFGC